MSDLLVAYSRRAFTVPQHAIVQKSSELRRIEFWIIPEMINMWGRDEVACSNLVSTLSLLLYEGLDGPCWNHFVSRAIYVQLWTARLFGCQYAQYIRKPPVDLKNVQMNIIAMQITRQFKFKKKRIEKYMIICSLLTQ